MQSTLFKGVYIGPTLESVIRQGDVTDICQVTFDVKGHPFETWEVRPRKARLDDDWLSVTRDEVVIPGHSYGS
jgi:hypothetical protein